MTPAWVDDIGTWDAGTPAEYLLLNTTYGLCLRQRRALLEHIKDLNKEITRLKEYEWMYKELCK